MGAGKPRPPKPSHKEELLDEALEESFPASDPASLVEPGGGISGTEEPPKAEKNRRRLPPPAKASDGPVR